MQRTSTILLALLAFAAGAVFAQTAELTVWTLPSDETFPGDLIWMIDDSLFVAIHDPDGLARFEPNNHLLWVWEIPGGPGEFAITNPGLFFTLPFEGRMGWLQPDLGAVDTWPLPSFEAQPLFLIDTGVSGGGIELWYADWGTKHLGRFAPIEITLPPAGGVEPVMHTVLSTTALITATTAVDPGESYPKDPNVTPAVQQITPMVSPPFAEWELPLGDAPPYGLAQAGDGRIWMSGAVGDPLFALMPGTNDVTLYDLPGDPWVTGLAAEGESRMWYLAIAADESSWVGRLDFLTGNVRLWPIPGPDLMDAVGLRIIHGKAWFCDRENSTVYRFSSDDNRFAWWDVGFDTSPLYIEPGLPEEYWISLERSGQVARLRLAEE